jgi:predicted MFS family arabinose efflux permease
MRASSSTHNSKRPFRTKTKSPALVDRDQLVPANTATRMSFSVAAVTGSSLGGLLASALGAANALRFDSATFALAAVLLVGVSVARPRPNAHDDGPVRADCAIQRDRRQFGLVVETVTGAFSFTPDFPLLMVFAIRDLELTPGQLGTALGVGAIGAIAGSTLSRHVNRRIGLGPAVIAGAALYSGALLAVPLVAAGAIGTLLSTRSTMVAVLMVGILGAAWLLFSPLRTFHTIED